MQNWYVYAGYFANEQRHAVEVWRAAGSEGQKFQQIVAFNPARVPGGGNLSPCIIRKELMKVPEEPEGDTGEETKGPESAKNPSTADIIAKRKEKCCEPHVPPGKWYEEVTAGHGSF